jgi:hypothetical protein
VDFNLFLEVNCNMFCFVLLFVVLVVLVYYIIVLFVFILKLNCIKIKTCVILCIVLKLNII